VAVGDGVGRVVGELEGVGDGAGFDFVVRVGDGCCCAAGTVSTRLRPALGVAEGLGAADGALADGVGDGVRVGAALEGDAEVLGGVDGEEPAAAGAGVSNPRHTMSSASTAARLAARLAAAANIPERRRSCVASAAATAGTGATQPVSVRSPSTAAAAAAPLVDPGGGA
jgi:hypothetical protein